MTDEQQIALEQRAHKHCLEMYELLKYIESIKFSGEWTKKLSKLLKKIEQ